jgi:hypothetical protein
MRSYRRVSAAATSGRDRVTGGVAHVLTDEVAGVVLVGVLPPESEQFVVIDAGQRDPARHGSSLIGYPLPQAASQAMA